MRERGNLRPCYGWPLFPARAKRAKEKGDHNIGARRPSGPNFEPRAQRYTGLAMGKLELATRVGLPLRCLTFDVATKMYQRFNAPSGAFPENPPDKWLTLPIMVLENSKLVKMTVLLIAPWLPMRLSGNTLLLKLFPKN